MPQRNHPVALLLAALAFARMLFNRLPLPVVLLGLAPVSIAITAFGGQEDTVNTSPSSLIVAAHCIASPEMFLDAEMLPHLICSRPILIGGAENEADQHGSA